MQVDFLKDIVSKVAGTHAVQVVDILHKKKNVNEFLIAKKLNLTINQTRNILYKLADEGLVSFIRKKDSKKGGWYIYFWTLNTPKAIELLRQQISARVERLEVELKRRKSERFYYSPSAEIEYTEEQALENDFICPETGEVMELKDTSNEAKKLESEIEQNKKTLEEVESEFEEIQKKEQQTRDRKARAEQKKKEEERAKKRAARKKENAAKKKVKKKAAKKVKKKTIKKKKVKKKAAKKKTKRSK